MDENLILGTSHGIFIAQKNDSGWKTTQHNLQDHHVNTVNARGGMILAGTREGVFRSDDQGEKWYASSSGLDIKLVRWMASHPDFENYKFVGTEPAGIFVSKNGGATWRACPEVEKLRKENGWWLPYSPEDGCVRGFAFHGERGYAAVEVGGVLRSDDRGETWELAPGSQGNVGFSTPPSGVIHDDVHSIEVHPSSPNLVFAPTNAGLYRSENGGETWKRINSYGYTRAVWLDPQDPNHLIVGPARGVDRGGTIQETHNGGQSWREITNGLDTPWDRTMVERFSQVGEDLLAVLSNGKLITCSLEALEWKTVLLDQHVNHVVAMEV